jgi:hypothetical protein
MSPRSSARLQAKQVVPASARSSKRVQAIKQTKLKRAKAATKARRTKTGKALANQAELLHMQALTEEVEEHLAQALAPPNPNTSQTDMDKHNDQHWQAQLSSASPLELLFAEFLKHHPSSKPMTDNQAWKDYVHAHGTPDLIREQELAWSKTKCSSMGKLYEHMLKHAPKVSNLVWRMHVLDRGTPAAIAQSETAWTGRVHSEKKRLADKKAKASL